MNVRFDPRFDRELRQLATALTNWSKEAEKRATKAHRTIGTRWKGEAQKRAPVDEGTLRQRIVSNTYHDPVADEIVTEVGTNLEYGAYVEFGTDRIAGGRVKALGYDETITDAQAVKLWPAKNFGSLVNRRGDRKPGLINEQTGEASTAARALDRKVQAGGLQEQMPWLRPAFNSIREWVTQLLDEAFRPPEQK